MDPRRRVRRRCRGEGTSRRSATVIRRGGWASSMDPRRRVRSRTNVCGERRARFNRLPRCAARAFFDQTSALRSAQLSTNCPVALRRATFDQSLCAAQLSTNRTLCAAQLSTSRFAPHNFRPVALRRATFDLLNAWRRAHLSTNQPVALRRTTFDQPNALRRAQHSTKRYAARIFRSISPISFDGDSRQRRRSVSAQRKGPA